MSTPRPTKILVVDDNPGTRYATSRVLRASGFTVVEAATGQEALAAVPEVDLVVLDINLPDIDGFEVCRRIRANSSTHRMPVIHLSATFVQETDKARGLEMGADGYLTHPVEAPVLLAAINAFLRARQAEDSMRESEAKFRTIFDLTPHGIALVSQDFVYLEVNPALCRILGRTREQIIGKHNSAFTPVGREAEVVAMVNELQSADIWRGNSVLMRSDAAHVEVEWTLSAFSVPGVRLALVADITQRRRADDERERLLSSERAARAEAEKANRLKDDFLATLSHELRTPLNAIVGWTQILQGRDLTPEDLAEGLESIDRNVKAQSQLIADLLDASRITTGKLRLELQEIDADAVINTALNSVAATAAAKEIVLRRTFACGAKIWADPSRLQQIVWNLVTNAIKFSPAGATVEVRTSMDETSMILIVEDQGQGIAADFLPHLFDRFSQADTSAKRIHGGLGIGLAIVKNLVEMHGGQVEAASDGLGKGSRFNVRLPLLKSRTASGSSIAATEVAHDRPAVPPPDDLLNAVRILIVDDDFDSRKVLSRVLMDFQAIVKDAGNVRQALELVPVFKPDILVSDIGMPGQDGYDLIRQIRKRNDAWHNLPAIALTAFSGKENIARSLREGFQVHLVKPLNPNHLVTEIGKLLGRG